MGFPLLSMLLGPLGRWRKAPASFKLRGGRDLAQLGPAQGVPRGRNNVQHFYGMTWGLCCKLQLALPLPLAGTLSGQAQL